MLFSLFRNLIFIGNGEREFLWHLNIWRFIIHHIGLLTTIDLMGTVQNALPNDNNNDQCAVLVPEQQCGLSGDGRTAEQPGLTGIHVIFVREHNRIATELSKMNRDWDDERLYQETRRIVSAIWQHITYNEYLPLMLGADIMRTYGLKVNRSSQFDYRYDPTVSIHHHTWNSSYFLVNSNSLNVILMHLNV